MIFNKGAVMVLPTGTNKATGLRRALADLGLAPHNTVGVGDAENDQAFLGCVECSVAVANALQSVKDRVDLVTQADHGKGVVELIDCLLSDDLQSLDSRLTRHQLLLGHTLSGEEVRLTSYGRRLRVAGPSGGGKTTVAASLLERLAAAAYQYCIIDPEGDYQKLPEAVSLSGADAPALLEAVLEVLARPGAERCGEPAGFHVAPNRPACFLALLPRLQELLGRQPSAHWIALGRNASSTASRIGGGSEAVLEELPNLLLITVHPDHVAPAALALVDSLIVVGRNAQMTVERFASATESSAWAPTTSLEDPAPGEAWLVTADAPPIRYRVLLPESDRRRHRRKYAEGELGPDKSFYFRGPDGRLNLRAQNLTLFTQLAEGVDDATWLHHLRQQDYSTWIRDAIKDDPLADIVLAVEQRADLLPARAGCKSWTRFMPSTRRRVEQPKRPD